MNRLSLNFDLNAHHRAAHSKAPAWVPPSALAYLAHTEHGIPVRRLAKSANCAPSTISRQIGRWERLRDDRLIDEALSALARAHPANLSDAASQKDNPAMNMSVTQSQFLADDISFEDEARRILRRLIEPGAVLAIAADMEKGVVVRDTPSGTTVRTAIVAREQAQALAVKDWITCDTPDRISRYKITAAGRSALNKLLASAENRAQGFAEAQFPFEGTTSEKPERKKTGGETPLMILARRKDVDGTRFLQAHHVAAAERLREDYEMAQSAGSGQINWESLLTHSGASDLLATAPALTRAASALAALGEGLGDVALRCCCYLEGVESAERSLGWSARSGKIVLRIALDRLARYYDALGEEGKLIG